jgi:hypothetical protein
LAERGSALLGALFLLLIVAGTIAVGSLSDRALDRLGRAEVEAPVQAQAVAHAGLVDAYAWFRRQQIQPVASFAPQRDLSADPPINETDDPSIGLVREYEIGPSLWARYEVRRGWPAEPYSDDNQNGLHDSGEGFTDLDGDGTWDAGGGTIDVSERRGQVGTGSVWMLVSHGMVYRRLDPDAPLGTDPNVRLAIARVATEIRRLALTPPADAALCVASGATARIGNRARILGSGGGGVVYAGGTGSPTFEAGAEVSGSPSSTGVPGYDGSIHGVFGVGLAELKSMADISTSDPDGVPGRLGDYSLVVVDGDIEFDAARPLRGTGIVVVLGDCRLRDGSNSFFNGLLWVGGNLEIRAPAYLRGTAIVQGSVDLRGLGGDYVEIDYDAGIIGELLSVMGQYRHTKAIYDHDQDYLREGLESGS